MRVRIAQFSIALLVVLAGCGGGGGSSDGGPLALTASGPGTTDLRIRVVDLTGAPIAGAIATFTVGASQLQAVTNAQGIAGINDIRSGEWSFSVSAAGFETSTGSREYVAGQSADWEFVLAADGAWAIGRAIVLGTRVLERAADGTAMTFSLDVAVIDGNSEPIETLTSAQFGIGLIDCGWGGPRDCASDAEGNATPELSGVYAVDGGAQAFELLPPPARRPYVAGVLVERSTSGPDALLIVPALRSFFGALGGNDSASLMSFHNTDGASTFQVYGPFTNDGTTFYDAIDQLATPAEGIPLADSPQTLEAVTETTYEVAGAEGFGLPEVERHVLVLNSGAGLAVSQVQAAAEYARASGVRVSTIVTRFLNWYGFTELAARTGGMVATVDDPRQYELVFGAMDRALAGALPFYRMQYRFTGERGTFVAGGNVKTRLVVRAPSPLPNRGVVAELDVAIP